MAENYAAPLKAGEAYKCLILQHYRLDMEVIRSVIMGLPIFSQIITRCMGPEENQEE